MITVSQALKTAEADNPGMVVVTGLEFPQVFAFTVAPPDNIFGSTDNWYCIDKKTGEYIDANPLSDPSKLNNAKVLDV